MAWCISFEWNGFGEVYVYFINRANFIKSCFYMDILLFFLVSVMQTCSDRLIASMNSVAANLHVQLNDITIKLALILLKSSLDLGVDELLDNLGAATDEVARVGKGVDVGQDRLEERSDLDALDQVVVLAFLLDHGAGLVGEHADLLVGVLAGVALLDHGHDDVLGCHLRELLVLVYSSLAGRHLRKEVPSRHAS
jgi:hypothetical protein